MRAARVLALFLVFWLLSAAPSPAGEESSASSGQLIARLAPSPPVSFVDERALTVTDASLKTQKGLSVLVHNDSSRKQAALVEVVGLKELDDLGTRKLLSQEPVTVPLAPGQTETAKIPIGKRTKPAPTAGSYSLLLVAGGASGPVSRRELTVVVEGGEDKPDRGAELAVDSGQDVTLVAVNFVPSLLSGLGWLFLAAGLLVLVALFVLRSALAGISQALVVILAGTLIVIAALFGVFDRDLPRGESLHAISSRPIPVSPDSHQGTVGTPTGEEGELTLLEVSGGRMRPQHLKHAGSYKGPYDLAPDPENKGKGTATVNVRDWWPYALLALAMGVWTGYRLRRWYKEQRPAAKLALRRDEIARLIAIEDDAFQRKAEAERRPYAEVAIPKRLKARFDAINRMIEEGSEKTGEALGELESYLAQFARLRTSLRDLAVAFDQLVEQVAEEDFGLGSAIDFRPAVEKALAPRIDSTELDSDAAFLKAAQTEVTEALELVELASRAHSAIALHLRSAEAALAGAAGDDKEKLEKLIADFRKLGRSLLQADDLEDAAKVEGEDHQKLNELMTLLEKRDVSGSVELDADRAIPDAYFADFSEAERAFSVAAVRISPPRREPVIEVLHEVLGVPAKSPDEIHVQDILVVRITVSSGLELGFTAFEVDFGDGSPPVHLQVDRNPGPVEVSASCLMTIGGGQTVTVRTIPGGREIKTLTIEVDSRPRVTAHQETLKKREKLMTRLAGVLAVGSGLATLYLTNASWGEPVDYLAAILWGGVTAEGVKLAAALADRKSAAG